MRKYGEYRLQYGKDHLKRIPLDVRLDEYDKIKAAAEEAGEPVNTYIKNAIRKRMTEDKGED